MLHQPGSTAWSLIQHRSYEQLIPLSLRVTTVIHSIFESWMEQSLKETAPAKPWYPRGDPQHVTSVSIMSLFRDTQELPFI